jgi:hypothetical protein
VGMLTFNVHHRFRLDGFCIDCRCADRKKSWRVKRRHRCHYEIGVDSPFQRTPKFTPKKKGIVKPAVAYNKNTAFEHWLEALAQILNRVEEKLLSTFLMKQIPAQ